MFIQGFLESLAPATREYIESKVQDNALFPSLFNPPAVLTLEMDKPFCAADGRLLY
jgi:hypothetical protein